MQELVDILGLLFLGAVVYTAIIPEEDRSTDNSIRLFGKGK
jgi:hypothetical protein